MASIDGSVKDDLASLPSLGSDGSLHLNEEEAIERQAEVRCGVSRYFVLIAYISQIVRLEEQLFIERKIKQGAERLRATSMQKSESISKEEVELQIKAADAKISALSKQITELQQSSTPCPLCSASLTRFLRAQQRRPPAHPAHRFASLQHELPPLRFLEQHFRADGESAQARAVCRLGAHV